MRVLYLGMTGAFSRTVLEVLLSAGVEVCGVVVGEEKTAVSAPLLPLYPEPTVSKLPLLNPFHLRHIVHLAWERNIPAFQMSHPGDAETLAMLARLRPDVACVACFSHKIPPNLLQLPPAGFLNVHPSLLPAYRGPAPLFWQFYQGEENTGVTIHFMDKQLDTGDIILQTAVPFPDGITGPEADQLCAHAGGSLLVVALQQVEAGTLTRLPQSAVGRQPSYHPWPKTADFTLPTSWSAKRAFNFIRGTAEWGPLHVVAVGKERVVVETAVAYQPEGVLERPLLRQGGDSWIQFTPGVLHIRKRPLVFAG